MLLNLEYLIKKYNLKIKGIIHGGAHLAEEKDIYRKCNIENVLWIEGNPELAEKCTNILLDYPGNEVYSFLLSDKDDLNTTFHISNDSQCSSLLMLEKHKIFYPHIVESDIKSLPAYRLDKFIDNNNIDISLYNFINFDLQGAELMALKGMGDKLNYIDYIYTEISLSNLYDGCVLVEELDEYLSQYGFKRIEYKLTDSEWGDALYIKQPNKTQIVIHIMPEELIQYERIATQLKLSSQYLDDQDDVCVYITLNLSPTLYDWDKSNIKQKQIINDFEEINKKHFDWCETNFEIITDNSILGTTAQKRKAINSADDSIGQFIFLDTDIYFHEATLKCLLNSSKNIPDCFYVVCPQTVKLWDNTWDVITNEKFINEKFGFEKTFDPNETLTQALENIFLSRLDTFKFACGWFTLYSKSFLKLFNIPESFGPYGPEDTFWMYSSLLASQKYPKPYLEYSQIDTNIFSYIGQYVLNGLYVTEDYKYRPVKYTIPRYDLKSHFRAKAEKYFDIELKKIKDIL